MCLADALGPASATALAGFAPLSSMDWMIDFYDDRHVTRDGWWLLEARSDFASRGHSSQDMTIWHTSGQCVAKGRNTYNLFPGRPARGMVIRLMEELGSINDAVPAFPHASAALVPLRRAAEAEGCGDFSPLWSGTDVSGCREVGARAQTQWLASGLVR